MKSANDLHERAHPGLGEAHAHARKAHLGDGGVHHPVAPEAVQKALGGAEHAARAPDVLAHAEHALVALHLLGDEAGQRRRLPVDHVLHAASSRKRWRRAADPSGPGSGISIASTASSRARAAARSSAAMAWKWAAPSCLVR